MALKFGRGLIIACVLCVPCSAVLYGCQSVAGIDDLDLSSSDAGDSGEDVTVDAGDAAIADGSSPDASMPDADAGLSDVADGGDAQSDAHVDATGPDAADAADAGDAGDAADAAVDVAVDQTVEAAVDAATDVSLRDAADGAVGDSSDAASDSSDSAAAADATQSDASDATVAASDAADSSSGPDAGLQLVLIDDQKGTSAGKGWLDGKTDAGAFTGTWFTYVGDVTSTVSPLPDAGPASIIAPSTGGGGSSGFAAHMSGAGGTLQTSSAGMGFNLINQGASFDASAFQGIVFWGRSGLDGGTTDIRFQVKSANTSSFGFEYGEDLSFSNDWTQFVVHFSDLTRPSWAPDDAGTPAFTDEKALIGGQFQVGELVTYDIWVEDVSFIAGP